jgi:hypothetical protein
MSQAAAQETRAILRELKTVLNEALDMLDGKKELQRSDVIRNA